MIMMSAGMGERFAAVAAEFTDKIRRLGPNPVKRLGANATRDPHNV